MHPIQTLRVRVSPVGEAEQPDKFLELFNSNPDFIEASEPFTGRRTYELADAEMYLAQETSRENSRCLAVRLLETDALVGTACLLVPHDREPYPWIGLLLIHHDYQGQGLGAEVAGVLEETLIGEGWSEVRLSVLQANPDARRFWERLGYAVFDERSDQDRRPCWAMRKLLSQ